MGKFLKTCLIIGIVCIVLGFAASSAGISFGGLKELKEQMLNGEWSFGNEVDLDIDPFFELEEQNFFDDNEILNVDVESKTDNYGVANIREIHVKCSGVRVDFMENAGNDSSVANNGDIIIQMENTQKYQNYEKEGILYINASNESKNIGNSKIVIMVPAAFLQSGSYDIKLEASAGEIFLASLNASDVEIDMSAGTVNWDSLTAGALDIEVAAGTINGVETTVANKTDLSMNAGTVDIGGVLGTETNIELSAGTVNLKLEDGYTSYNYDVSCAGGKVVVGEETVEGVAKELELKNQAAKKIDVECSLGTVTISFANIIPSASSQAAVIQSRYLLLPGGPVHQRL